MEGWLQEFLGRRWKYSSKAELRRLLFFKHLGMYIYSDMKDKVKKGEKEDESLGLCFSLTLNFVAFGWLFTILFFLAPKKIL